MQNTAENNVSCPDSRGGDHDTKYLPGAVHYFPNPPPPRRREKNLYFNPHDLPRFARTCLRPAREGPA